MYWVSVWKGAVTWEERGSTSAIDLAFLSPGLQDRLITCAVRPDLDFGSDHYPIPTELEIASIRIEPTPRRCWKQMDRDIIQAGAQHLLLPLTDLTTPYDIDSYADYVVRLTQDLIDQAVPWSRPSTYAQQCGQM